MGRRLPKQLSQLGWRIYDRMRELGLEPASVAAAAGVSPSTLYRIMRADSGRTPEPRLKTKLRLARALRTPMSHLFEDPQLELVEVGTPVLSDRSDSFGRLLLNHYRNVLPQEQHEASRAAAFVLVDLVLSLASDSLGISLDTINLEMASNERETLLLILYYRLPPELRRHGAKTAIRAMLSMETAKPGPPTAALYRAVERTNWSEARIARNRPPLSREE